MCHPDQRAAAFCGPPWRDRGKEWELDTVQVRQGSDVGWKVLRSSRDPSIPVRMTERKRKKQIPHPLRSRVRDDRFGKGGEKVKTRTLYTEGCGTRCDSPQLRASRMTDWEEANPSRSRSLIRILRGFPSQLRASVMTDWEKAERLSA